MKTFKTLTLGFALIATLNVLNAQGGKLNSKNLIESSNSANKETNTRPLYSKVAVSSKESKPVYTTSQAIAIYKKGDYLSAIEPLSQIVESNAKDVYAMYYLALSYFKTNQLEQSANYFEKLLFTDITFHISYFYLSKIAFENKNYDKAMVNVNEYMKQNPHSHEGMHLKGLIFESKNMLKDALSLMNNAIKINNADGQYHLDIARVRIKLKSISKACEDLTLSFKLGNEDAKSMLDEYCIGKKEVIK